MSERSRLAAAIVVAAAAWAIAARGLISAQLPGGHDARIYIVRLVEFDNDIRSGIVLPRWAPHLGAGHGEPTWVFVPPLMQGLAELLHLAGLPFIGAQNGALVILLLIAGAGMFAVGWRLGGPVGAAVAATAFLFAPYLLVELYVRQAGSEFAAAALLPLVMLGLLRIADGEMRSSMALLALSLAGVGLAHHVVFLMAFPPAVAASALLFRRSSRQGWTAIAGCGVALLIASWSWLPALAETGDVRIDALTRGYFAFTNHFATWAQLIWSPWGYGYSQPGPHDPLSFTVGPLLLVVAAAGVAGAVQRRATALVLAAVAIVGMTMATALSLPLWRALPILHPIAFPWRFLVLPAVALAPLCALASRRWPAVVAALVLTHAAWYATHAHPQRYLPDGESSFSPERIAAGALLDTSADEYRPRTAGQLLPFSPAAFDPPLAGSTIENTPVRRVFDVVVPRPMTVRLEIYAFPGWTVGIDGEETPSHAAPRTGLIEFAVPAGRHRIEARFLPTVDRAVADALSLLGIALAIVFRSAGERAGSPARLR